MIEEAKQFQAERLVSIDDLSQKDILTLYNISLFLFNHSHENSLKFNALKGITVANLFLEDSTRTKTSFELAAKRLGAETLNFSPTSSSIQKGETINDTIQNLVRMKVDLVVIRDKTSGIAEFVHRKTGLPVINAGDGTNEHPTQALLDLFLLMKRGIGLEKIKILLVGDTLHSRVAGSAIKLWKKLNIKFMITAPETITRFRNNYNFDLKAFYPNIIYTLRVQKERQRKELFPSNAEFSSFYGINTIPNEKILFMHPGPINRNIELNSRTADSENSLILDQVEMGIATRMAILYVLAQKKGLLKPPSNI